MSPFAGKGRSLTFAPGAGVFVVLFRVALGGLGALALLFLGRPIVRVG